MADGGKHPPGKVSEELIIVRRVMPDDAGAKGGAWKIAYADFVTAMMAFFLVMWLINAANEKTKAQVASYFNPVKLVDNTTSAKGIKTPGDRSATSSGENGGDAAPVDIPEDQKPSEEKQPAEAKGEAEAKAATADGGEKKPVAEAKADEHAAAEAAMLDDPYTLLAQLARQAPGGFEGKSDKHLVIKDTEPPGGIGQLARDPFDPLAWKLVPPVANPEPSHEVAENPADKPTMPGEKSPPAKIEQAAPHAVEQAESEAADGKQAAVHAAVLKEAEGIRSKLAEELAGFGENHPDVKVRSTSEGVLISLTDSINFDMFDVGSAKPRPVVVKLMEKVSAAVRAFDGKIVVRGHTDARPYRGKGYDNWRLSMARAQMAYYMLIRAGVDDASVERIEGYADKSLLLGDKPEAAENRRIEILLKVPGK